MTTIAHAWHQFRFDLLRMRWWLAAYVALVVVPLLLLDTSRGTFTSSVAVFTVALAMLAAATVVQGDAPLDPRAFWQGKPISPQGLGVAKLAFGVVLLVGAPVIVLAAALSIQNVPAAERSIMVRVATFDVMVWIAVAIAIATVSRDRKTAPLLLLAAFIAAQVATRSAWGIDPMRISLGTLQLVTIVGAAALVVLAYARMLPRRIAFVVAMAIAVLGSSTIGRSPDPAPPVGAGRGIEQGPETLRIVSGPVPPAARNAVGTRFALDNTRPDTRYFIRNAKITLHFSGRGPLTVGAHSEERVYAGPERVDLPAGIRLVDTDSNAAPGTSLVLDRIDWYERLPDGEVTRVEVSGELHRYHRVKPRILPWRTGRAFSERGRVLYILQPDTARLGRASEVEWSQLAPTRSAQSQPTIALPDRVIRDEATLASFLLIDRDRGEAMSLRRVGTGFAEAMYILPAVARIKQSAYLEGPAPSRDGAGKTAARDLLMQEWVSDSYMPVQVSFATSRALR